MIWVGVAIFAAKILLITVVDHLLDKHRKDPA